VGEVGDVGGEVVVQGACAEQQVRPAFGVRQLSGFEEVFADLAHGVVCPGREGDVRAGGQLR
jgi:hypothetical protein